MLGQLDLEAAFTGVCPPGEDVQDERRPIDDLDIEGVFEVLLLVRGELVVQNEDVIIGGIFKGEQLAELAFTDIEVARWRRQLLDDLTDDPGAGGLGQAGQLLGRAFGGLP